MRTIRDNIAFVLLGVFAVILAFFMLRLQSQIVSTQQPPPTPTTEAATAVIQQPTVLVLPTVAPTETSAPPAAAVETATSAPAPAVVENPTPTTGGYTVYGSLVIGAIHVGAITDRGYNQAHEAGLQQMIERIPDVRLIEAENVPETEEVLGVIDGMVQQGAQIIFAQSFGYLPFAIQAAEKYPNVTFLHPGGFELRDNLGTYWANNFEAMYLAGIVAGATTQTNQLGFITAFPIPNILASVNAFHLGARTVNPAVTTQLVINGSWVDPAKEAAATTALAAVGVDVVTMIVDSPVTVVQTAEALGIYTIGFHSDALQELAPNSWLTGVAYTWGNYYTQAVQQIRAGQWRAGHVRGGIESDMIQMAPFGAAVNQATRDRLIAARTDIIRGQLQIFQGPIIDNSGIERIPAGRAGGLELLDTTDWLVEGIAEFDASTVDMSNVQIPPTPAPAEPTATTPLLAPTATTVETPPTATTAPVSTADLILGVNQQYAACTFFTTVIAESLRNDLDLTVEVAEFANADALYAALADRQNTRQVDLTACFADPQDRAYLRDYYGFIKPIGEIYWRGSELRFQLLGNSSVIAALERDEACAYRFLKNLQFEGDELTAQDPAQWLADNAALISEWTSCELVQ